MILAHPMEYLMTLRNCGIWNTTLNLPLDIVNFNELREQTEADYNGWGIND